MNAIEWTTRYISSQVFAIIASILVAVSFFTKNKKVVLLFVSIGSLGYAVHYLLLGKYAGAVIDALSVLRGVWFYINDRRGKKKDYISLFVCWAVFITGGVLTYRSWPDVLTIIAAINTTFAIWQPSILYYRCATIVGSGFWIAYAVLSQSIFGTIQEIALLVLEIIGLIAYFVVKDAPAKQQTSAETQPEITEATVDLKDEK
ncbi:MAG: YgjV family protein [Clostridia bacterium]|nr:YgjV family protein [Clostridia bacterium]